MGPKQALALVEALLDIQYVGHDGEFFNERNPTILRAMLVADPDLVLFRDTMFTGVEILEANRPAHAKAAHAREVLGRFLCRWGYALQRSIKYPTTTAN